VFVVACVLLIGGSGAASGRAPLQDATGQTFPAAVVAAPPESLLWVEMRNLTLHLDERATIRVERLRGEVVSTAMGQPAVLDDPESFSIRATSGSVALTGEDLTTLLNDFIFAYRSAPLKRLRARPEAGHVSLTGTMHKGVDLRFEIKAVTSLTPEGLIRLRPTRTRILGIDGAKLLRALGLQLDDLLDLNGSRGATVKGNDIFLDPTKILPKPAIAGTVSAVRVEGKMVVIEFAVTPDDSVFGSYVRPDPAISNYIYFRGRQLRFGKLLMDDTDLMIVDADPLDAFDLNLKEYAKQLVAGTQRILPSMGVRVEMPDYDSLAAGAPAQGVRDQRAPAPRSEQEPVAGVGTVVKSPVVPW